MPVRVIFKPLFQHCMAPLPPEASKAMFESLGTIYPINAELEADLREAAIFEAFSRFEWLLKPGEINKRLYYIHKGLMRFYYELVDEETLETKEVNTQFRREGDTAVSVESWYTQEPSYEYIQTLEYTEVFSIAFADLEAIYRKHVEFNFTGRVLTIKYLVDWVKQINGIRKLKVADRYELFCKRDPILLQRVPQKYLASYLDTTPETLARIRGGY